MDTKLKNHDWIITIIAIIIQIIGIFVIFSSTFTPGAVSVISDEAIKQIISMIIGLIVYFALSRIDFSWFNNKSIILLIYAVTLALLVYVKFFGEDIANTNRWIRLGFFSFQPSEFAKLTVILLTGFIFSTKKTFTIHFLKRVPRINRFYEKFEELNYGFVLALDSLVVILPILLLILIQPSLGNTVITFTLWALTSVSVIPNRKPIINFISITGILTLIVLSILNFSVADNILNISFKDWGEINYTQLLVVGLLITAFVKYLKPSKRSVVVTLSIIGLIILTAFLAWQFVLTGYQKGRILTYLQGASSRSDTEGYQILQSQVAIGSGMIWGRGYLAGSQSSLNILTQAHNDFIFASFAEQFGFIGVTLLLGMYFTIILRIILSAVRAGSEYGQYVGLSVSILLLLHIFINIGMNLGKLPVTGIPLPLMSSGGSSILVIAIALGFVQSINSSKRPVDFADSLMLRSTKSSSLDF